MKIFKLNFKLFLGIFLILGSVIVGIIIPLTLKSIIDSGENFSSNNGIFLLILFILQAILMGIGNFFMANYGENIVNELRININKHLIYLPQSFFDRENSGELVSRLMNDTKQVREFVSKSFSGLIMGFLTIVLSLVALIKLDWKMTLAMVTIFPIMLLLTIPISKFSYKYSEDFQSSLGKLTNRLVQTYRNIGFIKSSTGEKEVIDNFLYDSNLSYKISVKENMVQAFSQPVGISVLFCAITIIFAYGGYRVSTGEITIGTMMSFLVLTLQLLNPIGGIFGQVSDYSKMKGSLTKIDNIFKQIPEDHNEGENFSYGQIKLSNVFFSYQDNSIINGINLVANPGQRIAIVGPSGSGKSTIAKLLIRLYPLSKGQITINNIPINQIKLCDLRREISYISQESVTIANTVRECLTFGLQRKVNDEEIFNTLEKVGFIEDLNKMDKGLDSRIGENGSLLSGGQKQRLSIAQSLLRKSSIIIFDEATANLDADNESLIMKTIDHLEDYKIVIIIAHRLSTIVNSDKIIFLKDGKISGQGDHSQLYLEHSDYRRYVDEQIIPVSDI